MEILSPFPTVGENVYGLPSWVQDFDHLVPALKGDNWPLVGVSQQPRYSASGDITPESHFQADLKRLTARGIFFDTVMNTKHAFCRLCLLAYR